VVKYENLVKIVLVDPDIILSQKIYYKKIKTRNACQNLVYSPHGKRVTPLANISETKLCTDHPQNLVLILQGLAVKPPSKCSQTADRLGTYSDHPKTLELVDQTSPRFYTT